MISLNLISSLKIFFWTSLFIVFYSYFGYGILLWLLVKLKKIFSKSRSDKGDSSFQPEVALVIAAYNEEDYIEEKIENSLQLNYPKELLELIFVTDDSNSDPQFPSPVSDLEVV